ELSSDGTISGTYMETKDEYFAMTDNMDRKDDPAEFEKDYLSDYKFDIDNFKIDENLEKGIVRYSFKFQDVSVGEAIGNKLLINPLLFTQLTKNSFQYEKRSYP